MSAKRKPLPAVSEPIRAFEIIDSLKPGQTHIALWPLYRALVTMSSRTRSRKSIGSPS